MRLLLVYCKNIKASSLTTVIPASMKLASNVMFRSQMVSYPRYYHYIIYYFTMDKVHLEMRGLFLKHGLRRRN